MQHQGSSFCAHQLLGEALCRNPSKPGRPVVSELRHHGGRQEDQEGAGVHQQQASPGDEIWQVHAGLHHHAQVAARRQGQARHHRQQLPAAAQVRDRVLRHAVQDRRAPLQRQQRRFGHRVWEVLPRVHIEHHRPRRLRHHPLHAHGIEDCEARRELQCGCRLFIVEDRVFGGGRRLDAGLRC